MLTKILQTLRDLDKPLELSALASQLEIDLSTLEGMLDQLVRQGKLQRSEELTAAECELEHTSGAYGNLCAFLTYGESAVRYEIVES